MQGGFLRNQRAITGVYYINPAAFTWASTILIAGAVFLPATQAACVHMQFSTASPMHVYNKAFSLLQAAAHRKHQSQPLSSDVSHTSFKLHNLLESFFKQKAYLARFSVTAPFCVFLGRKP